MVGNACSARLFGMDFCKEYINVKLSALGDEICVPVMEFL